jgi:hypothetical protein
VEQLLHVKVELASRGKKIKDLASALGWEYGKVSRVLNGFQPAPENFDQQVRVVLSGWDAIDGTMQFKKLMMAGVDSKSAFEIVKKSISGGKK